MLRIGQPQVPPMPSPGGGAPPPPGLAPSGPPAGLPPGGAGPSGPPPGAMLPMAGKPPLPEDKGSVMDVGKVKPDVAGYMGSEDGPFECERCIHFAPKDSTCEIVSGKIDPEGCCNLFESNPDLKGKDPDKDSGDVGEADQGPGGIDPQALMAALGGGGGQG